MDEQAEPAPISALLEAGYQALADCRWHDARAHFESAVDMAETGEALEGLAVAAWWLDDAETLFEFRERAFSAYRRESDSSGAARVAIWLALDNYIFRHAPAIANGWMRRAQRILDDFGEPTVEHCLMAFSRGHIALENYDTASAGRFAREARELGQRLGIFDVEMLALALQGLAEVSEGQVDDGMSRLDEAVTAALGGEMSDPDAIVTSCCYLFYACERVRDYQRAAQWCGVLTELCRRWSYRSMVSVCRAHYAGVLIWQGEWDEAERELSTATEELLAGRAGWAPEGLLRLGELRRLQGRTVEAAELFRSAQEHPLSLLGRAELAFEEGDLVTAGDLVDRFSRRVRGRAMTERVQGLDLQVRVNVELGREKAARDALAELEITAQRIATEPIRGTCSRACALVAASANDHVAARRHIEDAVDLFVASGSPFEAALSRLELARILVNEGRAQVAAAECRDALSTFQRLGARSQASRTEALLREVNANDGPGVPERVRYPGLSRRESEILRLIADGYTNPQIADKLFLSVRTVERHVSSIYQKVGAEGKAARAIATAFALEHSTTSLSEQD